ncbi:MAG: 2,3-bisphosphoglycerate-independent phosphoglycerate mutase [Deltaproteobacteria bacterium]|jgi:2,3-bisphosphoglycerate-independent phosphoglycerate mutase|nr:2,3-bisphosphoglycerate-independent phosphoglycerate mutase [Deltaproteobacteria bacterium]
MINPVFLIIRDGWGHREETRGNAVAAANPPFINSLLAKKDFWTLLDASGEPVGLPDGYQGSSEVGHLNMGAGRIVLQELKRIDDGLKDGSFFQVSHWVELMDFWKTHGGSLHLMGLLQNEGVHAHQEHLFKIMRRARSENPTLPMIIHPFLDGRDTPPRSSPEFLTALDKVMTEVGNATLGTMMGRYYAMDRGRDYPLTDQAFRALVAGEALAFSKSPIEAVQECWDTEKTPDGGPMVDEYIPPLKKEGYPGIKDGDCVVHFNYRQDRAIQLTQAFVEKDYPGKRERIPHIKYLGLTRYYDSFSAYLLAPMGEGGGMERLLGEIISEAKLRQLRIAETQKFRHVTSFFNGKSTTPYPLEDQVEIKGRFDPATFAMHPEMEAEIVTDLIIHKYLPEKYPFVALNYANCDMVGHTGNMEDATRAVKIVDSCIARLVASLLEASYEVLVTADHGNADEMIDLETGLVKTSHTLAPVELFYVSQKPRFKVIQKRGKLADIAPTILQIMGLPIPPEMTADSLVIPIA